MPTLLLFRKSVKLRQNRFDFESVWKKISVWFLVSWSKVVSAKIFLQRKQEGTVIVIQHVEPMSSGIFLPRSHVTRRKVAALNNQGKRNLGGRAHKQRFPRVRKLHSTVDSILASCLMAQGLILSVSKIFFRIP